MERDYLYSKITKDIIHQIESGKYEIGDRLPSEYQLVAEHGISRNTARRVLDDLVGDGYARRIQGKGSYVENTKINQNLAGILSLSELLRSNNRTTKTELLDFSVIEPSLSYRRKLKLDSSDKAIRIYRMRYADSQAAVLNEVILSYKRFSSILKYDLEIISLYDYLYKKEGVFAERVEETLEIITLNREEANYFQQKQRTPAFLLKGITYDNTGCPFEIVKSIYRADLFKFSISLQK